MIRAGAAPGYRADVAQIRRVPSGPARGIARAAACFLTAALATGTFCAAASPGHAALRAQRFDTASGRAQPDGPIACASVPQARDALRPVAVDVRRTIGHLHSLQGVNGAPAPGMHKPPAFTFGGWNMPEAVDTSAGYREARIDLVRTHDAYGPGDIDAHFNAPPPSGRAGAFNVSSARSSLDIYPDASADPNDPRSYHFAPTDRLVASIVNLGAQTIFRLGRSETSEVTPPRDFDRYASVVEHIVRHYNGGWDHGYRYGLRYWEIWNEPDLGKLFWGGTPQQFYELYAKLARAVKRADPTALVGGPTLAKPNEATPYRDDFLRFVRAEHLPLDFYSWHWYATDSDDPLDFVRIGAAVRERLDRFGFRRTLSVLDEWNYGLVYPLPADIERAAFVATALIYMEHAPIDLAALYRADSLFGRDGATPNETGGALIAVGRMKETPFELEATGGDRCGFAVEAGRSADGRTLQILLSNYQIPQRPRASRGYTLTVRGLQAGAAYEVERYRIATGQVLVHTEHTVQSDGSVRVSAVLPPPGVDLLVIRRSR
ncbi:MAG TPA: hypothetical protein VMD49_04430 [Steroidobacteraceae bacterium]|nr:hypothetical protein [Steroidobacteraceae bacterium]